MIEKTPLMLMEPPDLVKGVSNSAVEGRNMKKRKIFYGIVIVLLLTALGLQVLSRQGEEAFKNLTEKRLASFHENISRAERKPYGAKDFSSLPEGAKEYLMRAMPRQGVRIQGVRMKERGEIRVHDEASWKPFSAVQYVSTNPPQLIWSGQAEHWPLTPVSILTTYMGGRDGTEAYFWGLLSAFENRGLEMKAYLMVRWLGEAVWYPTALLPGDHISWETVPSKQPEVRQARVRFRDGEMAVSGIFTFMKSSGAPLLFMLEDGGMPALNIYKWFCTYSDWKRSGDFQIPQKVTEGTMQGFSREERLRITVFQIDYER